MTSSDYCRGKVEPSIEPDGVVVAGLARQFP